MNYLWGHNPCRSSLLIICKFIQHFKKKHPQKTWSLLKQCTIIQILMNKFCKMTSLFCTPSVPASFWTVVRNTLIKWWFEHVIYTVRKTGQRTYSIGTTFYMYQVHGKHIMILIIATCTCTCTGGNYQGTGLQSTGSSITLALDHLP